MNSQFTLRVVLSAGAVALLIIAAGIVRVQRRAKSCPVHSKRVGAAAWIVAAACGLGGIALLGFVLFLE